MQSELYIKIKKLSYRDILTELQRLNNNTEELFANEDYYDALCAELDFRQKEK